MLGTKTMGKLRAIWREALRTADDDGGTILDLARAWCEIVGLSTSGAARLLVIVSDGRYRCTPRRHGQRKLNRLRANGCAVLWMTTRDTDTPLDGATVHRLTDPTTTARAIGLAATTALRTTR